MTFKYFYFVFQSICRKPLGYCRYFRHFYDFLRLGGFLLDSRTILNSTFKVLEESLGRNFLQSFKSRSFYDLYLYHFSLGLWIRNNLLSDGSGLCGLFYDMGIQSKDDMSMLLVQLFLSMSMPVDLKGLRHMPEPVIYTLFYFISVFYTQAFFLYYTPAPVTDRSTALFRRCQVSA